jgi:predicted flap endonuclease-1-like 5' DNA nuclease
VIYVVGQIWIWLLVALGLGIAIGWLWTRLAVGGRLQDQLAPWRDRVTALERERDQLRRELGEVRDRATESETRLAALRDGHEPPALEVVAAEPRANGPATPADSEAAVAGIEPADEAGPEPDPQPVPRAPEPTVLQRAVPEPPSASEPAAPEPSAPAPASFEPAPIDAASDNLTSIKGIGKALEARLNGLGITTYAQIAALTEIDIRRIDDALGFRGRVARDRWIAQAQALIDGQRTNGTG